MASNEAKVKVRLDTRLATAALRGLNKAAEKTATSVGSGAKRALGLGLGAIGLGGALGVGAGVAKATASLTAGAGDVAGIYYDRISSRAEDRLGKGHPALARAASTAASKVEGEMLTSTAETMKVPAITKARFRFELGRELRKELGRTKLRADLTREAEHALTQSLSISIARIIKEYQLHPTPTQSGK